MVGGNDVYEIFSSTFPLYVAMFLAYGSVRWWKILAPEQCSGINRFVAVFAVPFLFFEFIASNDPYAMNYRFMAADTLQKVVILVALFIWQTLSKRGNIEWVITLFALSTLPNTLIIGIPLMKAMYGDSSVTLMVQIGALQSMIWYTLMIIMYEYRAARLLITRRFPENAGSIASFRVHSEVLSLDDGREILQTDAHMGDNGQIEVVVRRSSVSSKNSIDIDVTPRESNLTAADIYSVQSSCEPTLRASSFNQQADFNQFPQSDLDGIDQASQHDHPTAGSEVEALDGQQMPPIHVLARIIFTMVCRKLIRNPNTYSSILGLAWSLISYKFHIKMPTVVSGSISILSNTGLGMAMFSLGLFMALQPKFIACGKSIALFAMVVRFLVGPAVVAACSVVVGLGGALLHVSIVQAALPLAVVPFVFAKEYNVHAEIISTSVIFGMPIGLAVTIVYYILLEL